MPMHVCVYMWGVCVCGFVRMIKNMDNRYDTRIKIKLVK